MDFISVVAVDPGACLSLWWSTRHSTKMFFYLWASIRIWVRRGPEFISNARYKASS